MKRKRKKKQKRKREKRREKGKENNQQKRKICSVLIFFHRTSTKVTNESTFSHLYKSRFLFFCFFACFYSFYCFFYFFCFFFSHSKNKNNETLLDRLVTTLFLTMDFLVFFLPLSDRFCSWLFLFLFSSKQKETFSLKKTNETHLDHLVYHHHYMLNNGTFHLILTQILGRVYNHHPFHFLQFLRPQVTIFLGFFLFSSFLLFLCSSLSSRKKTCLWIHLFLFFCFLYCYCFLLIFMKLFQLLRLKLLPVI